MDVESGTRLGTSKDMQSREETLKFAGLLSVFSVFVFVEGLQRCVLRDVRRHVPSYMLVRP
jgi:hypothetical protein